MNYRYYSVKTDKSIPNICCEFSKICETIKFYKICKKTNRHGVRFYDFPTLNFYGILIDIVVLLQINSFD